MHAYLLSIGPLSASEAIAEHGASMSAEELRSAVRAATGDDQLADQLAARRVLDEMRARAAGSQ